jgi:CBS domain-containing protein
VVDEAGQLVGVVSQTDIIKLISKDLSPLLGFYHFPLTRLEQRSALARDICEARVEEIMERRVHSVTVQDDISTAARMMRNLHIHRVLVLENGKLVGILTALDLLRVLERPKEFQELYRAYSS